VADLVQHVDIVPTILDLVKAPGSGGFRGRSLKPVLEGTGKLPETSVYSEALYARYHFGWSELTALTDDRYRYIKAPREELYDLQRDAGERTNIAGDRAQARQALRGALDRLAAGAAIQAPAEISADARERLQALGYVGAQTDISTTPGDALADPKDKREILERYREAVDSASQRRWPHAIALLQQILRDDPEMADVWNQLAVFATRIDRFELAVDAYQHYIELKPQEPTAYIGAAAGLLKLRKLDEAREHAQLAADVAAPKDHRSRASAHEMLAKIALAKHDADTAREEARLAHEEDATLPLPLYIDARLLYDQGKYADALPLFQQAIADLKKPGALQMTELHFYTGDTLGRLDRYPEAETEFIEELKFFPHNTRARGGLAMLYQASGKTDEAARILSDMLRVTPTPDAYALAVRLHTMFGNRQQADEIRADARRAFADSARPRARASR
jgi:tetratricopeptide (TPR) repeat protein